jgi:hypothetical protein
VDLADLGLGSPLSAVLGIPVPGLDMRAATGRPGTPAAPGGGNPAVAGQPAPQAGAGQGGVPPISLGPERDHQNPATAQSPVRPAAPPSTAAPARPAPDTTVGRNSRPSGASGPLEPEPSPFVNPALLILAGLVLVLVTWRLTSSPPRPLVGRHEVRRDDDFEKGIGDGFGGRLAA